MYIAKATFSWFYKTVSNWRLLFKCPEIEVCSYVNAGNMLPFFGAIYDEYRRRVPNMPYRCPVKPGRYFHTRITNEGPEPRNVTASNPKYAINHPPLPNGRYKVTGRVFTKEDPHAGYGQYQFIINRRLGEEDF